MTATNDPLYLALEQARRGLEDAARIVLERSTSNASAIVAKPVAKQQEDLADLRTVVIDLVARVKALEADDA